MEKFILHDATGKVPEHQKQEFIELIKESHKDYSGYQDLFERIDTDDVLYRIKFEIFVDPKIFLIHVLEYEQFNKITH